jgi:uncharacterized protein (DUF1778 family)
MARITSEVGVRLRPSERALIDRAAELAECSRSELLHRAAVARAKRIISEAEGASGRAM